LIYAGSGHPRMARTGKSTRRFLKDTSKKDLVTRAGRLGGRRYNRCSLQVESVYSDYLSVAILGNVVKAIKDLENKTGVPMPTKGQWVHMVYAIKL
jgi:hypothetical protein